MANTKVQSEQIQDGSITADKIADGAIVATEIADNAVTTAKINADAVTGAKIADDAIDSEHYTDGSIDTAHIADAQITVAKMAANSVDSDQYVDGSIDTVHIGDAQVTTAKITDGNISTAKIADNAVTSAKIDTNIDIAGTFDVTGATTLDAGLTVDTTTLVVDATNNRVGIGTASPDYLLQLQASDDTTLNIISGTSSGDFGSISFGDTDYPAEGRITYQNSDNKMRFWSDRQHVMTLDDNARVGIGTESPSQKLHVSGGSGASTLVQFGEAYDTSLYIKATDTASAMLRFQNASDTVKYSMGYRNESNAGPFRIRAAATLDSGGHRWDFDAAGTFSIVPNNTAALMNITASGTGNDATVNFATALNARGIYLDDSDTNSMKFYTGYGKGAANREIIMNNLGDLAIGATRKFYLDAGGDTYITEDASNQMAFFTGGGKRFALIGGAGYFSSTVTQNHNFSDLRLKENIAVIPNALEKVSSLRGITFTRKDDGSVGTGLIAQELEKVLPEAVYESRTMSDDDDTEYKAITYDVTVGLLVEAIKEQQTIIEAQTTSINDLKTRIEALES